MQPPSTWPPLGYDLLAVISGTHKVTKKKTKEQDLPCSPLETLKCKTETDGLRSESEHVMPKSGAACSWTHASSRPMVSPEQIDRRGGGRAGWQLARGLERYCMNPSVNSLLKE